MTFFRRALRGISSMPTFTAPSRFVKNTQKDAQPKYQTWHVLYKERKELVKNGSRNTSRCGSWQIFLWIWSIFSSLFSCHKIWSYIITQHKFISSLKNNNNGFHKVRLLDLHRIGLIGCISNRVGWSGTFCFVPFATSFQFEERRLTQCNCIYTALIEWTFNPPLLPFLQQ